jgi:hypothetical protein
MPSGITSTNYILDQGSYWGRLRSDHEQVLAAVVLA